MWMRQMSLLGFVKSTSSIGCVGPENNAPVDSNAGEPTRPCTSGIDCFGAEDGIHQSDSVESSTGEPSRPSCATTFVSREYELTAAFVSQRQLFFGKITLHNH